ncbi:MAG: hypothetical protein L6V86_05210 [Treponema sp.]|nr:MAG: hypothetical protein L6V86_05210 [Treponema sp.]
MAENKTQMATIYLFGKKYEVPAELTVMNAMEYAGYQLKEAAVAETVSAALARQFTA